MKIIFSIDQNWLFEISQFHQNLLLFVEDDQSFPLVKTHLSNIPIVMFIFQKMTTPSPSVRIYPPNILHDEWETKRRTMLSLNSTPTNGISLDDLK